MDIFDTSLTPLTFRIQNFDNVTHSDNNVSFNSSSNSIYAADEEIIKQRGRRYSTTTTTETDTSSASSTCNYSDSQSDCQSSSQFIDETRDLFLEIKKECMKSPKTNNKGSISCKNRKSLLGPSIGDICISKRNLSKSLLRTPIKNRLRTGRRRC